MNPVLSKDILSLLRLGRFAAIHVSFVAAVGVVVLASWPSGGVVSVVEQQRDSLLAALLVGQMLLLVLFVPGVSAVSLTGEREAGTLEMLYASRLTPWQIATGKIAANLAFPLLLLLSGVPFLGLLYFRGAPVSLGELLGAYAVLVVGAFMLASLAMLISAFAKQSATAMVLAYVATLLVVGGTMIPALIMIDTSGGDLALLLHYLRCLSPLSAVISLIRPEFNSLADNARGFLPAWQVFLVIAGVICVTSLLVVSGVLSKPPIAPERQTDAARRSRFMRLLIGTRGTPRRGPIGSLNPLLYKEARTNALRSGPWMLRIFYGSLSLSMILALMSLYGGSEYADLLGYVLRVLVILLVGIVALVAPSLTTATVSTEREAGTFEMLRMSRLTATQIFLGKFLPTFLPGLLPVVALVPAFGALVFVQPGLLGDFLLLAPLAVLFVLACCAVGMMCSSLFESTPRATVAAYVIVAGVVLLPTAALFAGQTLDATVAARLASPSPLAVALAVLPDGSPAVRQLYPIHLVISAGLSVLALLVAWVQIGRLTRSG